MYFCRTNTVSRSAVSSRLFSTSPLAISNYACQIRNHGHSFSSPMRPKCGFTGMLAPSVHSDCGVTTLAVASRRFASSSTSRTPESSPPTTTVAATRDSGIGSSISQLNASSLNALAPKFLFYRKLKEKSVHHTVITAQSFNNLARECGVANPSEARSLLAEAGYIVDFVEYVHLRPALLLSQCEETNTVIRDDSQQLFSQGATASDSMNTSWSVVRGDEAELRVLLAEEADRRTNGLSEPLRRLYNRQRFVWGCALLFCGFQACVIANLTFTEDGLGWDVMEPVSYFIGCYTSLAFFVFMLRYRREHSYVEFDKLVLVPKLRSKYARSFDWKGYDSLCAAIKKRNGIVEKKKAWMNQN